MRLKRIIAMAMITACALSGCGRKQVKLDGDNNSNSIEKNEHEHIVFDSDLKQSEKIDLLNKGESHIYVNNDALKADKKNSCLYEVNQVSIDPKDILNSLGYDVSTYSEYDSKDMDGYKVIQTSEDMFLWQEDMNILYFHVLGKPTPEDEDLAKEKTAEILSQLGCDDYTVNEVSQTTFPALYEENFSDVYEEVRCTVCRASRKVDNIELYDKMSDVGAVGEEVGSWGVYIDVALSKEGINYIEFSNMNEITSTVEEYPAQNILSYEDVLESLYTKNVEEIENASAIMIDVEWMSFEYVCTRKKYETSGLYKPVWVISLSEKTMVNGEQFSSDNIYIIDAITGDILSRNKYEW